jgi:hypothetical protein
MDRMHWYGEEPFPWIGVGLGLLAGPVLMAGLAWLGFELLDQNLERWAQ